MEGELSEDEEDEDEDKASFDSRCNRNFKMSGVCLFSSLFVLKFYFMLKASHLRK